MSGLLQALAIALLPAAGNIAGGLIAERRELGPRTLSYALHAATGIVLAVVGIELVADAIETSQPWIPIVAFIAGGGFFIAVDHATDVLGQRRSTDSGPWLIYFGVAMDLFSDGIMIGAGSAVSFSLALLIALGQVAADLPEGFAVIATMKDKGIPPSPGDVASGVGDLYRAIEKRHTTRARFTDEPPTTGLVDAMTRTAAGHGAWLEEATKT